MAFSFTVRRPICLTNLQLLNIYVYIIKMFLGGAGSLSALPASQPPLLFFRGSGGFTALVPTVRSRSQLRRIHRG